MPNDDRGRGRSNDDLRPVRMGDHSRRPVDDEEYGMDRYGAAPEAGYGAGADDASGWAASPGFDAGFGGPRFDRQDVGSTGTHGVHPVSSSFGPASMGIAPGGSYASSARRYAQQDRMQNASHARGGMHAPDMSGRQPGTSHHDDPHYAQWRERQMSQLDRDWHEYNEERQSTFEREFGAWRERRGKQREALGQIREHMEVVGSDGGHVGKVDRTHGDHLDLTRSDPNAGGVHHKIPCGWIDTVSDKVCLNLTADEATRRWQEEHRNQAMFSRDRDGEGPHMLNRAFAGTYKDDDEKR